MPVNITEVFVRQLMAQIDFLTKQNSTLTATVDSMNQTINGLNQTIKELKEQLNKNSKTVPSLLHLTDLRSLWQKRTEVSANPQGRNRVPRKVMKGFISLSFPIQTTSGSICILTVPDAFCMAV